MTDQEPILVFLHIPKTAGTTFHFILSREYRKRPTFWVPGGGTGWKSIQDLDDATRRRLVLVRGHLYYGVQEFLPRPVRYFTFLRNPVQRIVSYYHHALNEAALHPERSSWWYDMARRGPSLEEFVTESQDIEADNAHVRRISGDRSPFGELPADALETAKRNIEKDFAFVGLTEHFDESVLMMRDLFRWKSRPFYHIEKRNTSAARGAAITPQTRALIEECNRMDMELYEFARARFDEARHSAGPSFISRLGLFRRTNRSLSPLLPIATRGWRALRKRSAR